MKRKLSMQLIPASALLVCASFVLSGCHLFSSGGLDSEQQSNLDHWVYQAKAQYDDGVYTKAYQFSMNALEISRFDIEANVIAAWSLLQLGQYDSFRSTVTEQRLPGARELFHGVLELSPNEFKAKQGLATIAFSAHFQSKAKADVFERMAATLDYLRDGAVRVRDMKSDDPARRGELADVLAEYDRFLSGYEKLYQTRDYLEDVASVDDPNPDPKRELLTGRSWTDLELDLDLIRFDLERQEFDDALKTFKGLRSGAEKCAFYWEQHSLTLLEESLAWYRQMAESAPWHAGTQRNLGFVHIALGQFWLSKALDQAMKDAKQKLEWDAIPEDERAQVVRDFYSDESLHKSNVRHVVKQEFQDAIDRLAEFVRLEEEREIRRVEAVEEHEELAFEEKENIFLQDIVGRYSREMKLAVEEARDYRKLTVLLLLELYVYPVYGVQDLDKAQLWANDLRNLDDRDPIYYFILATIRERAGDLSGALEDYNHYLARSSIVEDQNRRSHVRDRINALTVMIRDDSGRE